MHNFKRTVLLLILLHLLSLPRALALEQMGSISLRMAYAGQSIPGGSITLYRIAVLGENWQYVPVPEFSECCIDLNASLSPADASLLSAYATENRISGQTRELDADGFALFSPLEPGLYLLVQQEAGSGYVPVKPFLVGLPQQIAGELHYHVDASPKCAPLPDDPAPPGIPQTGQLRWPVAVLTSLGLFLLAGGLFLQRKESHA